MKILAKYTVRIKDILENYYLMSNPIEEEVFEASDVTIEDWTNPFNTEYENPFTNNPPTVDEIITLTWQTLFNFEYEKLEDTEEGELERKIIKHYYMREIGFETVERFKLALNETLNRIMPYYNELARSKKLVDDPISNYKLIEDSTRNTDNDTTSTANSSGTTSGENTQIYDDTPSSELSDDVNYATTRTRNSGTSSNSDSSTASGTSDTEDIYHREVQGLMNYSVQDMIAKYRENIINIEEMIVLELRDLFMLIY